MKHEARIRTLAARYEACLTTEAEERELRSLLSDEQALPRDLEALAVMLGGLESLGEEQSVIGEIDKEKMEKLMVGHRKKFVRYDEGAAIYSMGKTTFRELARDAGAVYHVKEIV